MRSIRILLPVLFVLAFAPLAQASIVDVARAVELAQAANRLMDRLEDDATIVPAEPQMNTEGEFVLPYTADGARTEWSESAMTASAAGAVGGEVAGQAASRVPFVGGFMRGGAEARGAAAAAAAALGGWDEIRAQSDRSFNDVDELAVYMHVTYSGRADYQDALAATVALYPTLEDRYEKAVKAAQKAANREAKRNR